MLRSNCTFTFVFSMSFSKCDKLFVVNISSNFDSILRLSSSNTNDSQQCCAYASPLWSAVDALISFDPSVNRLLNTEYVWLIRSLCDRHHRMFRYLDVGAIFIHQYETSISTVIDRCLDDTIQTYIGNIFQFRKLEIFIYIYIYIYSDWN